MRYWPRLSLIILFAVAMAMVEAAVVVYLRSLYYPEGLEISLKAISQAHLRVEVLREAATLVMLATVAGLAGRERWERFGYFMILFGVWDIFYYFWLKVAIDWPASLTDWDVLFLIPAPWIGPVIAPVLVSAVLIVTGVAITQLYSYHRRFRPTPATWLIALLATVIILYTFMRDAQRVAGGLLPEPFWYTLFALGLGLYLLAFWWSYRRVAYNR